MDLTIHISDDIASALQDQAHAHGLTAAGYASRMIEEVEEIAEIAVSRTGGP